MSGRAKVAAMAAMARGRGRVDRGDFPGAVACFDRAAAVDPDCAQAFLYRAGLKLLIGDEEGALADFRTIEKLDHSRLPAYRDLTTLSAEEFPALVPATESLLRRAPDCAWGWVFRAFSLRSLMRYEEAVEDLDRAVACAPRSAALWAMRSRVKLTNRQGSYEGAADMEKSIRLAPDWGWLRCWLGEALRHEGRFRRALTQHSRGLDLDPRYLRGWAWRGGVQVALGRFREAISDLDRSLRPDPIYDYEFEYTADQRSWAHNQKAAAWKGLGETGRAIESLNRAHGLSPRYEWCYNPRRDPAAAESAVRELDAELARRPRSAWALAWRGWTLAAAGRPFDGLPSLERSASLGPRLAWPAAWRGRALFLTGDRNSAGAELSRALRLDSGYAPAWGWRGELRRAEGRFDEAIADFDRAVRLDHRCAWALAGRGECRLRLGSHEAARTDLDRALGILPGYPQALEWRRELDRESRR
jgi:tetratricopeptide (TPR) repeat protein